MIEGKRGPQTKIFTANVKFITLSFDVLKMYHHNSREKQKGVEDPLKSCNAVLDDEAVVLSVDLAHSLDMMILDRIEGRSLTIEVILPLHSDDYLLPREINPIHRVTGDENPSYRLPG